MGSRIMTFDEAKERLSISERNSVSKSKKRAREEENALASRDSPQLEVLPSH